MKTCSQCVANVRKLHNACQCTSFFTSFDFVKQRILWQRMLKVYRELVKVYVSDGESDAYGNIEDRDLALIHKAT